MSGVDSDILKKGGRSMSVNMVGRWRKFWVSDVLKRPKYVKNYKFWRNIFISIFNFFHFYIRWNVLMRKEKILIQLSRRKEKLRKNGLCFITTSCLIKPFKIIIFFFGGEWGGGRQIARNEKLQYFNICFKNNFKRLIV